MPARSALSSLRKDRPNVRQRLGLAQAVMRGSDVSPRDKESTLARTLHALQMRKNLSPGVRLALVEASLRISNVTNAARPQWLAELNSIYVKMRDSGAASDWKGAFGMPREKALGYCDHIRRIRRYPDYVDPISLRPAPVNEPPELPVGVSSGLKVSHLKLDGFRAAPGSVEIDLTAKDKPVSLVIVGDNGVGKSTLVSAIELACQGTVGRSAPALADASLSLINLATPRAHASVLVTLTDGTSLERVVERFDGRWRVSGSQTLFAFSLSPLTLQRADLMRFLNTPGSQRGQLFVGHFAADGTDEYARGVLERAKTAKKARQQFVQDLAGRAGQPPKVGTEYVLKMLSAIHLGGMTEVQWRETGSRLPAAYVEPELGHVKWLSGPVSR